MSKSAPVFTTPAVLPGTDPPPQSSASTSARTQLPGAVVRFAGDSGDGMQVVGAQFTSAAAAAGNDLATFPDFPAEIRAPAGTTFGVSGFQIHFAADDVFTPGDAPDVLVAMNPAALKVNLAALKRGGLLIANSGAFTATNLDKAGLKSNPLEGDSLAAYQLLAIDISRLTQLAVREAKLGTKEAARCKNFWTLGLMLWMYDRALEPALSWVEGRFRTRSDLALANALALRAGYAYGETAEVARFAYEVPPAQLAPGLYRNVSGNTALALGLVTAAELAGRELVLGAYPITPASDVLHELGTMRSFGVTTIQAEDEIAAMSLAIGAAYAGQLGVTTTSGPGLALKGEALGLAVAVELPVVVVDIQRGGPSTGLPTKTEQADLLQALFGRHGEAPVCVLAPATPADCFMVAVDAVRTAVEHMTPVIVLSDGYLANGTEPWSVPRIDDLEPIAVDQAPDPSGFHPFRRDPTTLARNWAVPGTADLMHRIGGLEKDYDSGHISYDPGNHARMTRAREEKVARIADAYPPLGIEAGPAEGEVLVLGWGSTYGAIHEAVRRCHRRGLPVAHAHLRLLNPLPRGLSEVTGRFRRLLVPELNRGQLASVLRATLLRPVESFSKVEGQPFQVDEVERHIVAQLESFE